MGYLGELGVSLLSRDEFRREVFARDKGKCVVCKAPAVDAHHIMERRLFPDGGYHLDNGASVCASCHIQAETTEISVEEIRAAANITEIVLPEHLSTGDYDKWGNPILANGQRLQGELFHDPGVQKVLQGSLHLFTKRVKYPRTYHLPWSHASHDDRIGDSDGLLGKEVVVTEKMDGENTTIYNDGFHARSLTQKYSRHTDHIHQAQLRISSELPDNWRLCGENLKVTHSIYYESLLSYFMLFAIWENNTCLAWDDTEEYAKLLEIPIVPVLWRGVATEKDLKSISVDTAKSEGFVVRLASSFSLSAFRDSVLKWVRPNHVKTGSDWYSKAGMNGVQ